MVDTSQALFKYKNIEITGSMISDHNGMKFDIINIGNWKDSHIRGK